MTGFIKPWILIRLAPTGGRPAVSDHINPAHLTTPIWLQPLWRLKAAALWLSLALDYCTEFFAVAKYP
jgi:hypothetical protein